MTNAQRWINRKRKIYKQKGDAFTNNNVRNELDMAMYNPCLRLTMMPSQTGEVWAGMWKSRFQFKDGSAIVVIGYLLGDVECWGLGYNLADVGENSSHEIMKLETEWN